MQSAVGHLGVCGIVRILHNRKASTALDCNQPRCAVVHGARQQHADHVPCERTRGGTEQRIDRRTCQILSWATPKQKMLIVQ
jgi:hypothetical protein